MPDFACWLFLFSFVVVHATNLSFPADLQKKCDQYWPSDGAKEYGKVHVETGELQDYGSFTKRLLKVTHADEPDVVSVTS